MQIAAFAIPHSTFLSRAHPNDNLHWSGQSVDLCNQTLSLVAASISLGIEALGACERQAISLQRREDADHTKSMNTPR